MIQILFGVLRLSHFVQRVGYGVLPGSVKVDIARLCLNGRDKKVELGTHFNILSAKCKSGRAVDPLAFS